MPSGCQPGVESILDDLGVIKFSGILWNSVDVFLGAWPYRIGGWDHLLNEILKLTGRSVVGHYPDSDAGTADTWIF